MGCGIESPLQTGRPGEGCYPRWYMPSHQAGKMGRHGRWLRSVVDCYDPTSTKYGVGKFNLSQMADKKGEETTSRGNEWEVVSLTASAYAAAPAPAPAPMQVESNENENDDNTIGEDKAETPRALFMSGHFVFPPNQHENLPLEPEKFEINYGQGVEDVVPELGAGSDTKVEENLSIEGLTVPDEGLDLVEEEQIIYGDAKFSSFQAETTMGGSAIYDDNNVIPELGEFSEGVSDSGISQFPKPAEEDEYDASDLPCEAWWKRGAASLYAHAKEADALWSVFIAAAVMGLVMLGQQWQRERWQDMQLKWQISVNDEGITRMMGPISRFKDVIVGGSRRSFIRSSSPTERQ